MKGRAANQHHRQGSRPHEERIEPFRPGAFPWRAGEVVIGRAGGRRSPIVRPAAQPSAGRVS